MIIPGFSKYNIESDGTVTCVATGRVIRQHIATVKNRQYARVSLKNDDGCVRTYNVMTLLAITYLGKPLHKGVVVAKDGNNLNTTLENVMCTTPSVVTKQAWQDGKLHDRSKRDKSYCTDSMIMVYEAMKAYDAPVSMATLSADLLVPYTTVRYSMLALIRAGKARKTEYGFEVIA